IRFAPGVFQLLTIEGSPQPVRNGAVEALQAAEAEAGGFMQKAPPLAPGAAVAVSEGVFEGHPGVVLKVGKDMALVALMMLGQLREVAVGVDNLRLRDE